MQWNTGQRFGAQIESLIAQLKAQRFVEIRDIESELVKVDPRSYEFKVRY